MVDGKGKLTSFKAILIVQGKIEASREEREEARKYLDERKKKLNDEK